MFEIIDRPIFLFFISKNNITVAIDKNIAPPKLVINFAIGVTKSDIKNVDISLYPIMSPFIISLLKTSSANAKKPTRQINSTTHFRFFFISSFQSSFIFSPLISFVFYYCVII